MSAICPECDSPIDVDAFDVDIGDELTCSECGSLLRVSSDAPLEFEIADEDDDLDEEEEEVKVADEDEVGVPAQKTQPLVANRNDEDRHRATLDRRKRDRPDRAIVCHVQHALQHLGGT